MANVVKLKRSAVSGKVPTVSALQLGEVALNTFDGNLFFKKDDGSQSIVEVVTTDGNQTLTNKTLGATELTGPLTVGGNVGSNGYILTSAGAGAAPQWVENSAGRLDGLSDVNLSTLETDQVLKYNGSFWVNGEVDVQVASAVFAANAQTDLGFVYDNVIGLEEDLGYVNEIAAFIYNMGPLVVDGIVSLSNLDQSVKADYIGYSIIFGF
jgi:hypothetical protein